MPLYRGSRRLILRRRIPAAVGGGAGTVFTFDNSSNGHFVAPSTTQSHVLPNVAANALCVISIVPFTGGGPVISVVDGVGSYTKVTGSPDGAMELWYAFRAASQSAGATITITVTTSCTLESNFASFTGGTAANIDTGGTYVNGATPSWTTTATNTLLIGAIGPNNGDLTATAPWVRISSANFNVLVYKIASAPLSSAPLVETGSGGYFGAVVTAFK